VRNRNPVYNYPQCHDENGAQYLGNLDQIEAFLDFCNITEVTERTSVRMSLQPQKQINSVSEEVRMSTQTQDGWKKALFILIFVVMAATVFAVTTIAPLSFIHSSVDNNLESLTDELRTCQSPARKVEIIQTLGVLNEASATGALQDWLGDQDPRVRTAAVSSIAKMRGLPALEALAMATQHPDPTVRDLAKWARLKRAAELNSEEIVESLEDLWQQHPESK